MDNIRGLSHFIYSEVSHASEAKHRCNNVLIQVATSDSDYKSDTLGQGKHVVLDGLNSNG